MSKIYLLQWTNQPKEQFNSKMEGSLGFELPERIEPQKADFRGGRLQIQKELFRIYKINAGNSFAVRLYDKAGICIEKGFDSIRNRNWE